MNDDLFSPLEKLNTSIDFKEFRETREVLRNTVYYHCGESFWAMYRIGAQKSLYIIEAIRITSDVTENTKKLLTWKD